MSNEPFQHATNHTDGSFLDKLDTREFYQELAKKLSRYLDSDPRDAQIADLKDTIAQQHREIERLTAMWKSAVDELAMLDAKEKNA